MNDLPLRRAFLYFVGISLFIVLSRSAFSNDYIYSVDESTQAVVARSVLEGEVIYKDIVDARPPLTHYLFAMVFLLFGSGNLAPIHILLTGVVILQAFLIFQIGSLLHSQRAGILAGSVFSVISFNHFGSDVLAFHTEWTLALFTLLGGLWLIKGLTGQKPSFVLMSGLAFGLAVISKIPAVMDCFMAVFVLIVAVVRRPMAMNLRRYLLIFCAALIGLIALFLAYLALNGALSGFLDHVIAYNARYSSVVSFWEKAARFYRYLFMESSVFYHNALFFFAVLAYLAVPSLRNAIARADSRNNNDFPSTEFLISWLVSSSFGAALSGRNFGHYFIQVFPPFCLIAGLVFDRAASGFQSWLSRSNLRVVSFPLIFGLILLFYPTWNVVRAGKDTNWKWRAFPWVVVPPAVKSIEPTEKNPTFTRVVSYLKNASFSGDKIFVWGFMPEIYHRAGLLPASRFLYCQTLTGQMSWELLEPWIDTSKWIVPQDWDRLVSDLNRNDPLFIADTSLGNWKHYAKYPIDKYSSLQAVLDQHYVPDRVFHSNGEPSIRVYRKKGKEAGGPLNWIGLIGAWRCEDSGVDSSPAKRPSVLYGTLPVEGVRGKALEFDGSHDFIDLKEGFAAWPNGLSLSVWAYPTAVKSWARFLEFGNGASADNIIFAREAKTNNLVFEIYHGDRSVGKVIAKDVIRLNEWQHFAVTLSPDGLVTVYKNGLPIRSGRSVRPAPVIRKKNYIGRSSWHQDEYYAGKIDEVFIFNRSLDSGEVRRLTERDPV